MSDATTTQASIEALRKLFDEAFAGFIAARYGAMDPLAPVIRYALEGHGKRVRPILCILAAESLDCPATAALRPAVALEMVHTYSLVHDDLPCMDNDDIRRGRPTAHKAFDEARALLAGDALLTDAFAVLTGGLATPTDEVLDALPRLADRDRAGRLVAELAAAAGGHGMVLGQALDLHWTARAGARSSDLDAIHRRKTGYLLGASTAMGAAAAGADEETITAFREFGQLIGLAFQIRDDLLDDSTRTGKSPGKDREAGKLTYLSHLTHAEAENTAQSFTHEAITKVQGLQKPTDALVRFALSLLERTY